MTVSVDPSSAAPLERFGAQRFLDALGRVDLLLPNRDEATALTGERDPAAAARALAANAHEVVVTLGADGALWTDGTTTATAARERARRGRRHDRGRRRVRGRMARREARRRCAGRGAGERKHARRPRPARRVTSRTDLQGSGLREVT